MQPFLIPTEPVRVALIGAGQRSSTVYAPMLPWLSPWLSVVAVCDPVREHADDLAGQLGVPAFYDIHSLVAARPMEAALIVTPVPSHHSISVYLSSHGIHNLAETSWCSLICQAQEMIDVARQNKVVVRVGENFFRFPIDRLVQALRPTNFIGPIRRIVSYNDHTGYHNNSRWISLAGAHPHWVQSLEHTIPTAAFHSSPVRFHSDETYRARFLQFPDNLLVVDHASNIKGFLGRCPRPGYTEWQGERGTVVFGGTPANAWHGSGEVRYCSDQALETGAGKSDQSFPIVMESDGQRWHRIYVDLPGETVQYVNPFYDIQGQAGIDTREWYGIPVAEHMVDFALAVRALRGSEFDEQDALMSLMIEVAAHESASTEGRRIPLPLSEELGAERRTRAKLREQFGVDPLDVDGMLALSYPKP